MESIRRVEIIVPRAELENILAMLNKNKVEGYTLLEKVSGMGHRGIQDGYGLTDTFMNSMIIWYTSVPKFEELKETIRKMLDDCGGICAVSEANWVKH